MSRRFGRTTSAKKSKAGAYGKGVGLGISVLLALIVVSLLVWLLRRSATDESTPATPEAGEGVEEAGVEAEEAVVGEASTSGEAAEQKDKAQATPAAARKAQDLGVDLSQIEGTGSGGRITVKDVREAAKQA
jgi:pyruvate/2-oxoglutarate dehydrogenase complex dihydrolipoamide acyltransferase (E2) component